MLCRILLPGSSRSSSTARKIPAGVAIRARKSSQIRLCSRAGQKFGSIVKMLW